MPMCASFEESRSLRMRKPPITSPHLQSLSATACPSFPSGWRNAYKQLKREAVKTYFGFLVSLSFFLTASLLLLSLALELTT